MKILPANAKSAPVSAVKATEPKKKAKEKNPSRSFEYTRYVGLQYAYVDYQDETMGDRRREAMGFYGVKLSGPDLVIEGASRLK